MVWGVKFLRDKIGPFGVKYSKSIDTVCYQNFLFMFSK